MSMNDLISRQAAIDAVKGRFSMPVDNLIVEVIGALPSAQPEQRWIPCSERLPENTEPVNITWVNRDPPSYYSNVKDIPFTATGHYHNGKWWWYSATCQDYLDEYGKSDFDMVDDGIEIIAWQPIPEPYEESGADMRPST